MAVNTNIPGFQVWLGANYCHVVGDILKMPVDVILDSQMRVDITAMLEQERREQGVLRVLKEIVEKRAFLCDQ